MTVTLKRGRPRSGSAKSGKQRTREYRARKALEEASRVKRLAHLTDVELARYGAWLERFEPHERRDFWLEFGRRHGFR